MALRMHVNRWQVQPGRTYNCGLGKIRADGSRVSSKAWEQGRLFWPDSYRDWLCAGVVCALQCG